MIGLYSEGERAKATVLQQDSQDVKKPAGNGWVVRIVKEKQGDQYQLDW